MLRKGYTNAISRREYLNVIARNYRRYIQTCTPSGSSVRRRRPLSVNGGAADSMEGFSRLVPILAALVSHGSKEDFDILGDSRESVADRIAKAIASGVDPDSKSYWGGLQFGGQVLCEASDISLAIWIGRDWIFKKFNESEILRIVSWLVPGVSANVRDNNWHLFPATIGAVLISCFGFDFVDSVRFRLERVREFYVGGGMFVDGCDGEVDHYTSWGFHYSLAFLQCMLNDSALDWVDDARSAAVIPYSHLISPEGWPVHGRSIHYRTAVTAVLSVAVMRNDFLASIADIRRCTDALWGYHLNNGLIKSGDFTLGFLGEDLDLVEGYSGPSSGLWCLRSLIPLFCLPCDHEYWSSLDGRLPIERGSYVVNYGSAGWRLIGDSSSGVILLAAPTGMGEDIEFKRPNLLARVKGCIRGRTYLPDNYLARYKRKVYSSRLPFYLS